MSRIVSIKLELINESIQQYQTELYSLTSESSWPDTGPGITEMIFITGRSTDWSDDYGDFGQLINENEYCFVIDKRIWLLQLDAGQTKTMFVSPGSVNDWLMELILAENNKHKLTRQNVEVVRNGQTQTITLHTLKADIYIKPERSDVKYTISGLINVAPKGEEDDYRVKETLLYASTEEDFNDAGGVITDEILKLKH